MNDNHSSTTSKKGQQRLFIVFNLFEEDLKKLFHIDVYEANDRITPILEKFDIKFIENNVYLANEDVTEKELQQALDQVNNELEFFFICASEVKFLKAIDCDEKDYQSFGFRFTMKDFRFKNKDKIIEID